ncbi:hypothetical protein PAA8504_01795 [Palleronia abyssalis]|uniref:Uncharacterized protein n=2 Tax=Palleronia abyssalis TaxID=1501240 RepID=A0A2R8BV21_9RHOB|nr:hypothetical protein PAA8504_01795 [Palleronia abyssalis]
MEDRDKADPRKGPGSTDDPNQANRTDLPEKAPVKPSIKNDQSDPDDPKTGPGSTSDPNQGNRT